MMGEAQDRFDIIGGEIDLAEMLDAAKRPDCGAVDLFVGTTRVDEATSSGAGDSGAEDSGAVVEYLEYEAYRPMADRKLARIGDEIRERWTVGHVSIIHRIGRVDPAEASVAIIVASPRRGAAFEASR